MFTKKKKKNKAQAIQGAYWGSKLVNKYIIT